MSGLTSPALPFPTRNYAFEIADDRINLLKKRYSSLQNIHINSLGLSSASGVRAVDTDLDTGMASLYKLGASQPHHRSNAMVRTGEDYCREIGKTCDLVKIDCEGHDIRVIEGFGDFLQNTAVIQFEFLGPLRFL